MTVARYGPDGNLIESLVISSKQELGGMISGGSVAESCIVAEPPEDPNDIPVTVEYLSEDVVSAIMASHRAMLSVSPITSEE